MPDVIVKTAEELGNRPEKPRFSYRGSFFYGNMKEEPRTGDEVLLHSTLYSAGLGFIVGSFEAVQNEKPVPVEKLKREWGKHLRRWGKHVVAFALAGFVFGTVRSHYIKSKGNNDAWHYHMSAHKWVKTGLATGVALAIGYKGFKDFSYLTRYGIMGGAAGAIYSPFDSEDEKNDKNVRFVKKHLPLPESEIPECITSPLDANHPVLSAMRIPYFPMEYTLRENEIIHEEEL
mmetsp:Transcript_10615/g.15547  ORF Transcript_10615/g.15547 Transcript_10615/m.15547 type:complete len:232 (+) Transcript_10615:18-713(+)